jgi:cell division protein FtsL
MSTAAIAVAEQQNLFAPQSSPEPVRRQLGGTPEIYFAKSIDNSRIVKVADPAKRREMKLFTIALGVLFMLVMVYVWQHFSSIEYGYKIETAKAQRDSLIEVNRALRLEDASLRDPQRIDVIARRMGMQSPQAGQVQEMEVSTDSGAPVMARAAGVSVISMPQ